MTDASISIEKLEKKLHTNIKDGLSSAEANRRASEGHANELCIKKRKSYIRRFFDQLSDKMILILLGAALISAVSSLILNESIIDSLIILAIVFLNALIGVIQESRAEKAIEALKKLTSPTATVIRNGKEMTIDAKKVVVGDIIIIRPGGFIPADA